MIVDPALRRELSLIVGRLESARGSWLADAAHTVVTLDPERTVLMVLSDVEAALLDAEADVPKLQLVPRLRTFLQRLAGTLRVVSW